MQRIRQGFTLKFATILEPLVKSKYKGDDRRERTIKSSRYVFKLCFYVSVLTAGYITLHDQDFTPPSLLGNGDPILSYMNHPLSPQNSKLKWYYYYCLTYHLDSFITHLATTPKKDFGELFLHHAITLTLVIFSYVCNMLRAGSICLFAHDWAESFIALCRIFVDLRVGAIIVKISFSLLIPVWAYTRCFILPRDVGYYGVYLSSQKYNVHYTVHLFNGLLGVLCVMHVYWLFLFLKMAYNMFAKNEIRDVIMEGEAKKPPPTSTN